MRLPNESALSSEQNMEEEEKRIVTIDHIEPISFFDDDARDPARVNKYINRIERMVRRSYEYKEYIRYLRNELDITRCSFFPGIDIEEIKGVGIEFHHYPFSLYDITFIVLNKHLKSNTNFSSFSLANEIVEIHYENIVGLVPLSKTVHELAHSGKIFINLNQVFGNVREFINRYRVGILPEHYQHLAKLIELSEKNENHVPNVLRRVLTFLNIEDESYRGVQEIRLEEKQLA